MIGHRQRIKIKRDRTHRARNACDCFLGGLGLETEANGDAVSAEFEYDYRIQEDTNSAGDRSCRFSAERGLRGDFSQRLPNREELAFLETTAESQFKKSHLLRGLRNRLRCGSCQGFRLIKQDRANQATHELASSFAGERYPNPHY